MANNEHINKVVKSTGETLIDLTSDTVTAGTLLQGETAHDRSGAQIEGAVIVAPTDVTETEDNEAYLYKNSEHDAVYDELVGGSVAWNQLIPTTGTSGNNNGVTFTNNGDGSWTLNGTTTSSLVIQNLNYAANKKNFVDGHKYLMYADSDDSNVGIAIVRDVGSAHYAYGKTAKIISYAEGSETASWARIQLSTSGYKVTNVITKPQVFDLTQMFGTTIADYVYNLEQSTAGSGIAWLKSYGFFTKDYYAYSAGGLVSVNTSGKKVVGKNLLDNLTTTNTNPHNGIVFTVDRELGTVTANGTATVSSGGQFRIIIPSELVGNYYFSALTSAGGSNYDAFVWCSTDGSRAKQWDGVTNSLSDSGQGNCQVRFEAGKTYTFNLRVSTTASNVVFKPMIRRADTDSTFEPYTSLTYPIQSTDLRGLYKLNGNKLYTDGDIYSADGIVTRKYGIVDLGTLDWTARLNNVYRAGSLSATMKFPASYSVLGNSICAKLMQITAASVPSYDSYVDNVYQCNAGYIYAKLNDSYTTADAFKTAMSGVYLIYELATPTTETASSYTSPQMVYRNGTEEYLDTRDVPIPVGGNRKYVDIPDWMINEYFDDLRAEASTLKTISKLQQENEVLRDVLSQSTYFIPEGTTTITVNTITDKTKCFYYIPNSVTSFDIYAFANCDSLTSITIPNSVTSIDSSAFFECTSLTSVTIPDSITSIVDSMFFGCTSLKRVVIPNSITSIQSLAFYKCTSLTSVTIPNSVTSIGSGAFEDCTSLLEIAIPDSITSINSTAFEDCTNLISITIDKPQGSISGAPWGAPNATVTWTG